ncbi:MAG: hypothetical protein ABEN55_07165 [Bradymonadaceae bacterium]
MTRDANFDNSYYRPRDPDAHRGEGPYGVFLLGQHASNMQTVAREWGTSIGHTPRKTDVDDPREAGPPLSAWFTNGRVAPFGSWDQIPWRFYPGIKEIELDLWIRVAQNDISGSDTDPMEIDLGVRLIGIPGLPFDIPTSDDDEPLPFATSTVQAILESTNANDNPDASRWLYHTITLGFHEPAARSMVAPRHGVLSLELAVGPGQTDGLTSASLTTVGSAQKTKKDRLLATALPPDQHEAEIGEIGASGDDRDLVCNALRDDPNKADQFIVRGPTSALAFSEGDDVFEDTTQATALQWRALHIKERYYPITYDDRQRRSLIPPQSDNAVFAAQQASQVWKRGECVGLLEPVRASSGKTIQTAIRPRKTPSRFVVFLLGLCTLNISDTSDYQAKKWGQIEKDSPSIDWEVAVDIRQTLTGGTFNGVSTSDTRQTTALAESLEGPAPVRNKGTVWQSETTPMLQTVPPNNDDLEQEFGGEVTQYWDVRRITLDWEDGTTNEQFLGHPLEVEIDLAHNGNALDFPSGTPLDTSGLSNADVRWTLYGGSIFAEPS